VSLNGQSISIAQLQTSAGKASPLPSFFQQVLMSLRSWWSGPNTKVRVWASNTGAAGTVVPAGVVTKIPMNGTSNSPAQSQSLAQARTQKALSSQVHGKSHSQGRSGGAAMPRAWHSKTFVAGRLSR
jgi:hypothetical protein